LAGRPSLECGERDGDSKKSHPALRPVGIQDSHLSLIVIQAVDGSIRFD
jgi:hypothetical protein